MWYNDTDTFILVRNESISMFVELELLIPFLHFTVPSRRVMNSDQVSESLLFNYLHWALQLGETALSLQLGETAAWQRKRKDKNLNNDEVPCYINRMVVATTRSRPEAQIEERHRTLLIRKFNLPHPLGFPAPADIVRLKRSRCSPQLFPATIFSEAPFYNLLHTRHKQDRFKRTRKVDNSNRCSARHNASSVRLYWTIDRWLSDPDLCSTNQVSPYKGHTQHFALALWKWTTLITSPWSVLTDIANTSWVAHCCI